jgi:hypothetical protein
VCVSGSRVLTALLFGLLLASCSEGDKATKSEQSYCFRASNWSAVPLQLSPAEELTENIEVYRQHFASLRKASGVGPELDAQLVEVTLALEGLKALSDSGADRITVANSKEYEAVIASTIELDTFNAQCSSGSTNPTPSLDPKIFGPGS